MKMQPGILVKGNDVLKRNVESAKFAFRPPPTSPRERISTHWRPGSSLRTLGNKVMP